MPNEPKVQTIEELQSLVSETASLCFRDGLDEAQKAILAATLGRLLSLLATAQCRAGDVEAARQSLDGAVRLASSRDTAAAWKIRRALMLPLPPQSRDHIAAVRHRMMDDLTALLADGVGDLSNPVDIAWTLFPLAYHAEADNRLLHGLFHAVCRRAAPHLAWTAPHCQKPRRPGKPRIGFISWHLTPHTISRLFLDMIKDFNGDDFEVTVAAFQGQDTAIGDLPGRTVLHLPADLDAARCRIADQELDLLIYLDLGMDYLTLFLAHARLARRQGVLWGHPDSTALDSVDYFFTPACMEPEDGESHYSEQRVCLPGPTVLYSRPSMPFSCPDRAALGLPEDAVLYLCPQTAPKFHPDFDQPLRDILDQVTDSVLVLLAGWDRAAMERVCHRIVGERKDLANRIVLLPQLERVDFLALFQACDVVLDPLHYSGGHTSLEAFAFGSPIVTWPGKFMRARHTAGFYRLMGVDDLVACDHRHYVKLAVALGLSPKLRDEMRQKISVASSVLYNDDQGVRALEQFTRDLVAHS